MSTEEIRAIELLHRVSYGRVATSMRAMPFVAPARHIVADGRVLLRMHRGLGYHRACNGSVVAYGADNLTGANDLTSGSDSLWSVQFTGTARIFQPTDDQAAAFGPAPRSVDGTPFEAVYMSLEPHFVTVHTLDHAPRSATPARPEHSERPGGRPRAPRPEPTGLHDDPRRIHHVA
ncbi:pyridoxamine 5'-phosphate oxidase family protein [Streptomyces sp. NPDC054861]